MTEPLKADQPALSPEEWKSGRHEEPGNIRITNRLEAERFRDLFQGHIRPSLGLRLDGERVLSVEPIEAHKLAALCLYQQPFGFTHEDAALVDFCARALERIGNQLLMPFPPEDAAALRSLTSRIERLLPPQP